MRGDDLHLILEHLLFNDGSVSRLGFANFQSFFIGVVAGVAIALILVDAAIAVLRVDGFHLLVRAY